MASVDIAHVPYRGGMNILQDLLSNQVSTSFAVPTSTMPYVRSGDLVTLAVTSGKRFRLLAEVPTLAEAGFPGFEMTVWWGLLAPAGTQSEIVDKLHKATIETLAEPEVRRRFEGMYLGITASTPAGFAEVIATETPRWAQLVRSIGLQPN